MKPEEAEEIIACLPRGRTPFHYFRDRYALMLLGWACGDGAPVRQLREGPWAPLLNKPVVREVLARQGGGMLREQDLLLHWCEPAHTFLLTLDIWNRKRCRYHQTSRGEANLVLQLNFNKGQERWLARFDSPLVEEYLVSHFHPVMKPRRHFFRNTLAWARLDVDLDIGEVLIEEIQNDWLRNAEWLLEMLSRESGHEWLSAEDARRFSRYCKEVLAPLKKIWSEIMLSATLWFIRDDLGVKRVWYHTADTGRQVKRIQGSAPPRSLYTRLPRRFGFHTTREAPALLMRHRGFLRRYRRVRDPLWFRMEIP